MLPLAHAAATPHPTTTYELHPPLPHRHPSSLLSIHYQRPLPSPANTRSITLHSPHALYLRLPVLIHRPVTRPTHRAHVTLPTSHDHHHQHCLTCRLYPLFDVVAPAITAAVLFLSTVHRTTHRALQGPPQQPSREITTLFAAQAASQLPPMRPAFGANPHRIK